MGVFRPVHIAPAKKIIAEKRCGQRRVAAPLFSYLFHVLGRRYVHAGCRRHPAAPRRRWLRGPVPSRCPAPGPRQRPAPWAPRIGAYRQYRQRRALNGHRTGDGAHRGHALLPGIGRAPGTGIAGDGGHSAVLHLGGELAAMGQPMQINSCFIVPAPPLPQMSRCPHRWGWRRGRWESSPSRRGSGCAWGCA